MRPTPSHPERGQFVRDQVEALRGLEPEGPGGLEPEAPGGLKPEGPHKLEPEALGTLARETLEVELFEFPSGSRALAAAARELRRRYRGETFDVVHAHFGLTAWPALAVKGRVRGLTMHGTDLAHPRTRLLTAAALPLIDLPVAVSQELALRVPGRRARTRTRVVPCGVDLHRFRRVDRFQARAELGLREAGPYLLFPADPARPEKRHDRALAVADALGATLLTLGGVAPEQVPLYVNAANAVLVPSEREGFGLAAIEALACDVPVLATPVGIHPQVLHEVAGSLCEPFDLDRWVAAAGALANQSDPRVQGRAVAERYSCARMAAELAGVWRSLVAAPG